MGYINSNDVFLGKKIGSGNTANCYLNKDGEVVKLYKKRAKNFFKIDDENLIKLMDIKSDFLVTPSDLIMKNNKVIGYKCRYIDAPDIKKIDEKTKVQELYNKYLKFKEEIKKISEETNIYLLDVHEGNLLYGDDIFLIDLDIAFFSITDCFENNICRINMSLIEVIFERYYNYMRFYDEELAHFYEQINIYNVDYFEEFLNRLYTILNSDEISLEDVRKNKTKLLRRM